MNQSQVIKIQGNESGWYQEAIFVIKKGVVSTHKDLQQEADMIIGNYAKQNGLRPPINSQAIDKTLNFILASSICILIICLCLL